MLVNQPGLRLVGCVGGATLRFVSKAGVCRHECCGIASRRRGGALLRQRAGGRRMMMGVLRAVRAAGMEQELAVQDAAERLDHANAEHKQQRGIPPVPVEPRTPASYRSSPPRSNCQNCVHS